MTHAMHGGSNATRELTRLDGIIDLLRQHIAAGGTQDDYEVETMYRDYWRIPSHAMTATGAVQQWAERMKGTTTCKP